MSFPTTYLLPAALLLLAPAAAAPDAEALFSQGVDAYGAEKYEHAVTLFERAAREQPSVSRYYLWLGKAHGRQAERASIFHAAGLAKKTRAAFERAVELDGKNLEALNDLLDYYLAAPSFLGGGEEKAESVVARLAEIHPAEGHRAQALLLVKRKDYEGAEREFRLAMELQPEKVGRVLELAGFLSERGRYAESDEMFDRAAKMAPDWPPVLFARGKELVHSKRDPERARQLLHEYLRSKRRPDDSPPSEVHALLKKL